MPLKQIKEEIKAKAEREVESVQKEGDSEARRILDESKAQIKALAETGDAATESMLASTRQGLEASAEIEAHKLLLSARESAVEGEAKHIRSMLVRELSKGSSARILIRAAAKELKRLSGRGFEAEIAAGPKIYAMAKSEFGANVFKGTSEGMVIRSRDRKVSVDLTIGGIADSASERIAHAVIASIPMPDAPKLSHSSTGSANPGKRPKAKRVKK
jgi:vacuolar-type H+-ATPase subunit E/Vma4